MSEPSPTRASVELIPVDRLSFDPRNPRLPEEAAGWSEAKVLKEMRDEWVIDELAASMVAHGYFAQEPMLVLPSEGPGERFIVLEGNRRLAALKLLHGETDDAPFDPPATEEQLERLRDVPCVQVRSRDEIWAYLGFRHIGGIKEWSPEAKARFITEAVERHREEAPDKDPFKAVGREFGSNALGVRNAYIALAILRHARDELGVPVHRVMSERFGVWTRLLNSPQVREYIGLDSPRTYDEVQGALRSLKLRRMSEVLGDMQEQEGRSAVLRDSRDATRYGRVIAHDKARRELRATGDLAYAATIAERSSAAKRMWKLQRELRLLRSELESSESIDGIEDLLQICRDIQIDARGIQLDMQDRLRGQETGSGDGDD